MPVSARGAALDGLIRACGATPAGLGLLRLRTVRALRKLVAFDAAFMAAADPETLLFTAAFADDELRPQTPRFMDNEFGAEADVNRFAELARAALPVASLDAATGGDRAMSSRWREIIEPLGLGDEARVALRVDGNTWGFLCLHRSGPIAFDERELRALRQAAPHIGDAIRRVTATSIKRDAAGDHATPGTIIVVGNQVAALGGAAEQWLEQFAMPVTVGGPLPLPVLSVVCRLRALEATSGAAPPATVRLANGSGALVTMHATRLHDATGDESIAVTIVPTAGADRASLLLHAHGLSPAQQRVAQLVLQGLTTRQIVVRLRISEHTVQDHLKAIFDKLGVRSRRELVSAAMQSATSTSHTAVLAPSIGPKAGAHVIDSDGPT